MQNRHAEKGGRRHNSTYTQVEGSCFYDSEVLNPNFMLPLKFITKNPHLRVAANL